MDVLIQFLLLAGVVGLLLIFVRSQHGTHMKAGKRVAFFVFLLLNAYAILRPEDVTRVAHFVGVGRGTDLLLYLLIVAFVFAVLNFYLRLRDNEHRLTDLARAVALREAELRDREADLLARERALAGRTAEPPPDA
jgi:small membrane protein